MPETVKFVLASCKAEVMVGGEIHATFLIAGKAGNFSSSCIAYDLLYINSIDNEACSIKNINVWIRETDLKKPQTKPTHSILSIQNPNLLCVHSSHLLACYRI